LVGVPPIAWIVLALLWFGATDMTPIFTVFIACFPIVFVGALQGARTLDSHLRDMASAFRLPPWMKFTDVYLPHIFSYVFPAWISALGMSWKIVVMAELLATSDGVGAALAVTVRTWTPLRRWRGSPPWSGSFWLSSICCWNR
jgi:NitT/TauT family transport system permease protein